jgi:ferric-dicitrate binding protein FerR (iron transport regulator)
MANATERITILVTPDDKAKIERRAKRAGESIGAFLRRSALGPDPIEEGQLAEALRELEAANSKAEKRLESLLEHVAARAAAAPERERRAREEGRAMARSWLEEGGMALAAAGTT